MTARHWPPAPDEALRRIRHLAPALTGSRSTEAFAEITANETRVRELLSALAEQGRRPELGEVCSALWRYWLYRGQAAEALDRLRTVLRGRGGTLATNLAARLHHAAGALAFSLGRFGEAEEWFARSAEIAQEKDLRADLCLGLARLDLVNGDLASMEDRILAALGLWQSAGDLDGCCTGWHLLAESARLGNRWEEAEYRSLKALALAEEIGKVRAQAAELCNLSDLSRRRGAVDEATDSALRALALFVGEEAARLLPYPVLRLAALAARRGDLRSTALLVGLADQLLADVDGVIDPSEADGYRRLENFLEAVAGPDPADHAPDPTVPAIPRPEDVARWRREGAALRGSLSRLPAELVGAGSRSDGAL